MSLLALLAVSLPVQAGDSFDADAAADGLMEMVHEQLGEDSRGVMRLHVVFTVKADREEEFLEAFRTATLATRQEPGNITYHMSKVLGPPEETDAGDDDLDPQYILFETWKNAEALDSHLRQPYLATLLGQLPELTTETKIHVMRPVLSKEHRKGGGKNAAGKNAAGKNAAGKKANQPKAG